MDYKKIKIIIWDLDDTFWKGTLSEGGAVPIEKNIELVKCASRHGVVNSICSKNDHDVALQRLQEMGAAEYFVFPSIDWTPKGERIQKTLKTIGLRPQNTLFLDDNLQNLNEARHYSPELMTAGPELIPELIQHFESTKDSDPAQKRLNQYKILEKKEEAKEEYSSNDDFLYSCHLQVEMKEECASFIDRIEELVQRSNQLNYTKVRSTKEELESLIDNENFRTGCVWVKDKFGDYGMVGFYAINKKENNCKHFLFSCRTIGQGVEQYVYAKLGYPTLTVVGDVVSMVNNEPAPKWINQTNITEKKDILSVEKKIKILFKGPCDLLGLTNYIKGSCEIVNEFTYVGKKGNVINSQNHSVSLCGLLTYTDEEKRQLISENEFMDEGYWKSILYQEVFDVVFLSSVLECNMAIYRKKGTRLLLPFNKGMYPMTLKENFPKYEGEVPDNGQNNFSTEYLNWFSEQYVFENHGVACEYIERMDFILNNLPKTTFLCVLLGSELQYEAESRPWMVGRELLHKEFNDALRIWAFKHTDRVRLIDINKVVTKQNDYMGSINHFKVRVYYQLAQEVVKVLNEITDAEVLENASRWRMIPDYLMRGAKKWSEKLLPDRIFKNLRNAYRRF